MVASMFADGKSIVDPLWDKIRSVANSAEQQVVARYTADGAASVGVKMSRQEIVTKLLSTCIGLAVSFTITYLGFKYLGNVLDPTREEKKQAQKRVSRSILFEPPYIRPT